MPTWTASAPSVKAAATCRAVRDPAGGDHGRPNRVDRRRDQRQRADQRVLGRAQERDAVPAGLEARGHDRVHAGLVERDRLLDRDRGPDRHDPGLAAGLEDAASGMP